MRNEIQNIPDRENRHVIGFINKRAIVTVKTQEDRLRFHEVSRIYYKWSDIEGIATREGDVLYVYDLSILGSTAKVMDQRIEYLMQNRITIQLSTGNQKVTQLPDFDNQYATHMSHVRAKKFFRKEQTKSATKRRKTKRPKLRQPLSDRILISYYQKEKGELSEETVEMTAKRLGTNTGDYYKYLRRILIAIANNWIEPPQAFPESLTKKIRKNMDIGLRNGEYVDLRDYRK